MYTITYLNPYTSTLRAVATPNLATANDLMVSLWSFGFWPRMWKANRLVG